MASSHLQRRRHLTQTQTAQLRRRRRCEVSACLSVFQRKCIVSQVRGTPGTGRSEVAYQRITLVLLLSSSSESVMYVSEILCTN